MRHDGHDKRNDGGMGLVSLLVGVVLVLGAAVLVKYLFFKS